MIQRMYIRCAVCNKHHTLRIQIGIQPIQRHEFACAGCSEPISLAFSIPQNGATEHINELKGAKYVRDADSTNTEFRYLASDFAADVDRIGDPMYFGAMEFMSQMIDTPAGKERLRMAREGVQAEEPGGIYEVADAWQTLQRCWRLENAGRFDLSTRLLKEISIKEDMPAKPFREMLQLFLAKSFGMNPQLLPEVQKALNANPTEFRRMLTAFEYEWKPSLKPDQYQVITEYFDNFAEHSQLYLYLKMDIAPPAGYAVTSNRFQRVRSFYSIAFELLSKQMVLLTALNNILNGRPFDQLQLISLAKYAESDAAKRRDNLAKNTCFSHATKEHFNGLRNAISHNWVSVSPDGTTLFCKMPGDPNYEMSYTDYLWRCGSIMKQICQLMVLEISIDDASRQFANVVKEPSIP